LVAALLRVAGRALKNVPGGTDVLGK